MHYRNGREAKNGDKVIMFDHTGKVAGFGVLYGALPGNDYCNGNIATIQPTTMYACLMDCLHAEDVEDLILEHGLSQRPEKK